MAPSADEGCSVGVTLQENLLQDIVGMVDCLDECLSNPPYGYYLAPVLLPYSVLSVHATVLYMTSSFTEMINL